MFLTHFKCLHDFFLRMLTSVFPHHFSYNVLNLAPFFLGAIEPAIAHQHIVVLRLPLLCVCVFVFRFLRGGENRGSWRKTSWGKEENQRQLNHTWRQRPNLNPVQVL